MLRSSLRRPTTTLSSDDITQKAREAFSKYENAYWNKKENQMATTPTSVDDNQQPTVKEAVAKAVVAVQSKSLRIKIILVVAAGIASLAFQPLGVIGAGLITLLATEVKS